MSSSFGDTSERAQHLPGNHMSMCRFATREEPGYAQVCGELCEILRNIGPQEISDERGPLGEIFSEEI